MSTTDSPTHFLDSSNTDGESPSSADIPHDIESEFKRMADDADKLLHSILNDEPSPSSSTLTTPLTRTQGSSSSSGKIQKGGSTAAATAAAAAATTYTSPGILSEDDDMTDELIQLDRETNDLQRELSAISELDQERVQELIFSSSHEQEEEELLNGSYMLHSNNSSPSSRAMATGSCGASAAPLPASFETTTPMLCQEVNNEITRGHTSNGNGHRNNNNNRTLFPYDPAVAELRALMQALTEDNNHSHYNKNQVAVLSRRRVLKSEPKTTPTLLRSLETSINWALVASFVIVWGTVVMLMDHAHSTNDFLDDQGNVLLLPIILR